MAFVRMRRALVGLASGALLLLAACGSGTIESKLQPSRIIVFGDAFSDIGQTGPRYTINNPSTPTALNVWSQVLAFNFTLPLTTAASGGTAYATGNARVVAKPDAAGNTATPTIKEQIDAFFGSKTIAANDLIVIEGGYSDIIAEMAKVTAGTQTGDQMIANVQQAARDLAAQTIRLVQAGGSHIAVTGVYDFGKSPWAVRISQQVLLTQASSKFNEALLVALVDQGKNVLYVDTALLYNIMVAAPGAYTIGNTATAACNSVDPGPGIGIGAGIVNSALCTTSTLITDATTTNYLFADEVYPAPQGHVKFGDYAYTRIRERW